ncbi:hypothetical protein TNCV_3577571 [Trichonephila clavipes]|uniref:Uncharacterized protein n=1 Tax=Trichonephila clavipes TaxID=2585209 RepID=A0A8X6RG42_TRICX|nr:hypothetical protein TNCV_3577571 [Trichonephila clavipes]
MMMYDGSSAHFCAPVQDWLDMAYYKSESTKGTGWSWFAELLERRHPSETTIDSVWQKHEVALNDFPRHINHINRVNA